MYCTLRLIKQIIIHIQPVGGSVRVRGGVIRGFRRGRVVMMLPFAAGATIKAFVDPALLLLRGEQAISHHLLNFPLLFFEHIEGSSRSTFGLAFLSSFFLVLLLLEATVIFNMAMNESLFIAIFVHQSQYFFPLLDFVPDSLLLESLLLHFLSFLGMQPVSTASAALKFPFFSRDSLSLCFSALSRSSSEMSN
jgi:hypothetical protein